jgi:uroporphyrinogen decarboxylase
MNDLERFVACMDYQPRDRCPNHELGVWGQTKARWQQEAPSAVGDFTWDWFVGEERLGLDRREYISVNYDFLPPFATQVVEETDDYLVARNTKGILTKALKTGTVYGTRMSMDQYLEFPVSAPADFPPLKARLVAAQPERYPADLDQRVQQWRRRTCPLVLGRNAAANGFYWRGRELMGTESLSLAWHDHPELLHEIMEFYADFVIETSRPVLEKIQVEYFVLNEDMAAKGGPLLGPETYRRFIAPHLRRMVDFFRSHGTRYFAVDTDGDPTVLIPPMMDAGVDTIWPVERASEVSPLEWRRRFGKSLRIWGGVDKRVLPLGPAAVRSHLRELIPLVEEGGFIPTIDHTVQPDVSWDDFCYYMDAKMALLSGDFGALE